MLGTVDGVTLHFVLNLSQSGGAKIHHEREDIRYLTIIWFCYFIPIKSHQISEMGV